MASPSGRAYKRARRENEAKAERKRREKITAENLEKSRLASLEAIRKGNKIAENTGLKERNTWLLGEREKELEEVLNDALLCLCSTGYESYNGKTECAIGFADRAMQTIGRIKATLAPKGEKP
jgi:hypothetical protein